MADEKYRAIQFVPFNSCVHPGFWNALTKVKLDILGLAEKPVRMRNLWGRAGLPLELVYFGEYYNF